MSLAEGARLCLVSLDGTTRSNITVGPPFEVAIYEKDALSVGYRCKFEQQDPHLIKLREAWNAGVQAAFYNLPGFDWEQQPSLDLSPQVVPNSKN
jgi:putative proteasome-type protease